MIQKVYLPTNWENGFIYFESLKELTDESKPNANNEFEYHEANIVWHNLIKGLDFDSLADDLIDRMSECLDDSDYRYDDCYSDFQDEARSFGLERKLSSSIGSAMNSFPPIRSYHFENISELKTLKAKDPA